MTEITVHEFLGMAFDNTFDFEIYDFAKDVYIFDSQKDKDLPIEIEEMAVVSWNMYEKAANKICLNVDSEEIN